MHKLLYVVACGAPPAAELPAFVGWAQQQGWLSSSLSLSHGDCHAMAVVVVTCQRDAL